MKKKIALCMMLTLVCVCFFGCGKTTKGYVMDNLSETTKVYYLGENSVFYSTLSVGEREKTYLLNGKSEENVQFALLTIKLAQDVTDKTISATIKIGEKTSQVVLEAHPIENTYMVDLEKKLDGSEEVIVMYENSSLTLQNLSKDFAIDAEKAIEIGAQELNDQIMKLKTGNNLNAECYLRVLDRKTNNFDGVYWCFSVINTKNENFSVVISTEDGSVLAKTE